MTHPIAVLVPVLVVTAGCLGAAPTGEEAAAPDAAAVEDWARRALTQGDDHDHWDPTHHRNLSTANFEVLGHDPLITDHHGRTSGSYVCGSAKSDGNRSISAVHSSTSDVAVVLADVTDPDAPEKLGEVVMPHTNVYDVEVGPDLDHVILATSIFDAGPDQNATPGDIAAARADAAPPRPTFRDACTGQERPIPAVHEDVPYYSGLVLVDISDPRRPVIQDYHPLPLLGGHAVHMRDLEDDRVVMAAAWDYNYWTSYFAFLTVVEGPLGPRLQLESTYQHPTADRLAPATDNEFPLQLGAHDGYLQVHPVTGEHLAYMAYGHSGLVIANIDDPAAPRFVGQWDDYGRLGPGGPTVGQYPHTALPIDATWEGRHYTFLGEECLGPPPQAPTCFVFSLDTTDPADPEYVGFWTLPEPVQWEGNFQFTPHYYAVIDRTLFVGAVHGGVWAVDVSALEKLQEMPNVGAFLPARESPKPPGDGQKSVAAWYLSADGGWDSTPGVGDVATWEDATVGDHGERGPTLIVWDNTSGVYTVRYDASLLMPEAKPRLLEGG